MFTVERMEYRREMGDVTEGQKTIIHAVGCIHPGTPEQIKMLPEEDQHEEFIVIYTDTVLSLGENQGDRFYGPDRIRWNGRLWKLVRLKPWTSFWFLQGYAVLIEEETESQTGG